MMFQKLDSAFIGWRKDEGKKTHLLDPGSTVVMNLYQAQEKTFRNR
jgi:hypothetical protein